jgi:hypothetical protein
MTIGDLHHYDPEDICPTCGALLEPGTGPGDCTVCRRSELPTPDCGDNSCRYAKRPIRGMRTNGGCRCDDCEACGSSIRPGSPQKHKAWCPEKDWIPEHHRPRAELVTLTDEREVGR